MMFWLLRLFAALRAAYLSMARSNRRKSAPMSRSIIPNLEGLEGRCCPSTLTVWNPAFGSASATASGNWSNGVPAPGKIAVFDGSVANKPCTIDGTINCDGVELQNGFISGITINSTVGLTVGTIDDLTSTDDLSIVFNSGARVAVTGAGGICTLGNLSFTGTGGTFELEGGTTNASNDHFQSSTVDWQVDSGATLHLWATTNPLNMSSATLTVLEGGTVLVDDGATGSVLTNNNDGGYIDNAGTIDVVGGLPTFRLPVFNHGLLRAEDGTTVTFNGSGGVCGNDNILMDTGEVNIIGSSTISCASTYTQTGGTLQTDTATEWLRAGSAAGVVISGGNIKLGTATAYGTLKIGGNLKFNGGEYDPKINLGAGGDGNCDLISVVGTVTINAGSKMTVTGLGTLTKNQVWTVLSATSAMPSFGAGETDPTGVKPNIAGGDNYNLQS